LKSAKNRKALSELFTCLFQLIIFTKHYHTKLSTLSLPLLVLFIIEILHSGWWEYGKNLIRI